MLCQKLRFLLIHNPNCVKRLWICLIFKLCNVMVSFSDAVDSALQTEYEMKFDGYELIELYKVLFDSSSSHLRVIARQMADLFFARVERLNISPFPDVEEDEQ